MGMAATATHAGDNGVLMGAVVVSRHGIRSTFPPFGGTSAYTDKAFPTAKDWGMSQEEFDSQHISPHGKVCLEKLGFWYSQKIANESGGLINQCRDTVVWADHMGGATRDVTTAKHWMKGFGCPDININFVDETNNTAMQPVLNDHINVAQCPVATEEKVLGTFGGDVDALTESNKWAIETVNDILAVPKDAKICKLANPNTTVTDCTLLDTGYKWTGNYYEGMFRSPTSYAQWFSEAWMLEYTTGIKDFAFGAVDLPKLIQLYAMHTQTMEFGTNIWQSKAMSSHQLAYIIASLSQMKTGEPLEGVRQASDKRIVTLFTHDTNIMYLRRLLGLTWTPNGYPGNAASTGGALVFELWKVGDKHDVRINYITSTPQQQRNQTNLTYGEEDPSVSRLVLRQCGERSCPWDDFVEAAVDALDIDCVGDSLKKTVKHIAPELKELKLSVAQTVGLIAIGLFVGFVMGFFMYWCMCVRYKNGCKKEDASDRYSLTESQD